MARSKLANDDPRRFDAVTPYRTPTVPENEADIDAIGFAALILNTAGLLLRSRTYAWIGLICALLSFLHGKGSEKEYRQGGLGGVTYSLMTCLMLYVQWGLEKARTPAPAL
ncbi:hypothetical protein DFJ73DRAFT_806328 [Zopfochytrium polystomum]|nr:hypothetical protein DFJ73DRAFT_806328 [Zopfochytrium polystomum]